MNNLETIGNELISRTNAICMMVCYESPRTLTNIFILVKDLDAEIDHVWN